MFRQLELFKLMEEFVYTYLIDKRLFYRLTIHYKELEDKQNGMSYVGLFTIRPNKPYEPIINISDYALRLSSNAYIQSGQQLLNSYEKYRLKVIFHEMAHLIDTYNDPEQFYIMTKDNDEAFDKVEENKVNELAIEFLKFKRLI